MTTDITGLSARDLARLIRRREVSAVEATEAVLARIEDRADLNAFITVCADEARAEARAADDRVRSAEDPDTLPPLLGVPYSVKDLTLTRGVRTTMGSAIFRDFVPAEDAVGGLLSDDHDAPEPPRCGALHWQCQMHIGRRAPST